MSLVSAKCTNCGAVLKTDSSKDASICDKCGSAFIVAKAIALFEKQNATRENLVSDEADRRWAEFEKQIKEDRIKSSRSTALHDFCRDFPHDYRGWLYRFNMFSNNMDPNIPVYLEAVEEEFNKVLKTMPGDKESFISRYNEYRKELFERQRKFDSTIKVKYETLQKECKEIQHKESKKHGIVLLISILVAGLGVFLSVYNDNNFGYIVAAVSIICGFSYWNRFSQEETIAQKKLNDAKSEYNSKMPIWDNEKFNY